MRSNTNDVTMFATRRSRQNAQPHTNLGLSRFSKRKEKGVSNRYDKTNHKRKPPIADGSKERNELWTALPGILVLGLGFRLVELFCD